MTIRIDTNKPNTERSKKHPKQQGDLRHLQKKKARCDHDEGFGIARIITKRDKCILITDFRDFVTQVKGSDAPA